MDENNRPDNQEQRLSVSESEQPVETRMEHKPPTPKRRGGFLPSLLGAIVGGIACMAFDVKCNGHFTTASG